MARFQQELPNVVFIRTFAEGEQLPGVNICVFVQTRTGKKCPAEEGESSTCDHRSGCGSSDR